MLCIHLSSNADDPLNLNFVRKRRLQLKTLCGFVMGIAPQPYTIYYSQNDFHAHGNVIKLS